MNRKEYLALYQDKKQQTTKIGIHLPNKILAQIIVLFPEQAKMRPASSLLVHALTVFTQLYSDRHMRDLSEKQIQIILDSIYGKKRKIAELMLSDRSEVERQVLAHMVDIGMSVKEKGLEVEEVLNKEDTMGKLLAMMEDEDE